MSDVLVPFSPRPQPAPMPGVEAEAEAPAPELVDWLIATLPELSSRGVARADRWSWRGRTAGQARVWAVDVTSGDTSTARLRTLDACSSYHIIYVKQHRSTVKFDQERTAYRMWLPQLRSNDAVWRTPTLLADSIILRALALASLPGRPLDDHPPVLTLPAASTEEHPAGALLAPSPAHLHTAGRFLASLHRLPVRDDDALALADALPLRLQAALSSLDRPDVISAAVRHELAAAADVLLAGLHSSLRRRDADTLWALTRVPCHRDFRPSNWLALPHTGEHPQTSSPAAAADLGIIDFEHARLDGPLCELTCINDSLLNSRPDLRSAFFDGYGRTPGPSGIRLLGLLTALHGLATLAWATRHGDMTWEHTGRRSIATGMDQVHAGRWSVETNP